MRDAVAVRYEVLGIERLRTAGRTVGLANVLVDVAGVELTLQGVRIVQGLCGLICEAPRFRHPASGRWLTTMVLPDELRDAIGAEVLAVVGV